MPLPRRAVLGAGLAATLAGCARDASAVWGDPAARPSGPATGGAPASPSASPSAGPSASPPRGGASTSVLVQRLTDTLRHYLGPTPDNPAHPWYAGAVVRASINGSVVANLAVGDALRYGAGPVQLPPAQRVAMRPEAIFDLASLTKVYTAILVLQQVDRGRVDLGAPVATYLPEFGKPAVTVSMLLAHTSGLPVGAKLSGLSWATVLATPLVAAPGTAFRYSSVGFMVLGKLVETVTGLPLDRALRDGVTGPLGLRETGFLPSRWADPARLVATDARSSRGLLRGVVHDDVANTLGGIAGHAGIFASAADVAAIGQALLDGGKRLLAGATVRRMLSNANPGLPAIDPERPGRTSAHGLGVVLDQPWFMGRLSTPQTFGHTGFTGTSFVVHPHRRLVLVLLTNRAHPNWTWANPDPPRVAVANVVA